ncbi:hypothetical protein ETB91_15250, partial [Lacticaseibacillus rhamnosus]
MGLAKAERCDVALGVIRVKLRGPTGEILVNALLDSGSDATLVRLEVIQQLGLTGKTEMLSMATLNGERRIQSCRVTLEVGAVDSVEMQRVSAWSVDHLPNASGFIPNPEQLKKWEHLNCLQLPAHSDEPISLLIGMDTSSMHWVIESKFGRPQDPYAVRTPLGWMLLGPVTSALRGRVTSNNIHLQKDMSTGSLGGVL